VWLCVLLSGCAGFIPRPEADAVVPADEQLAAGNHAAALGLYDEFLKANPDDAAVPRVRATRAILDELLQARATVRRLEEEATRRLEELRRAQSGLAAVRDEAKRLKDDSTRLELVRLQMQRSAVSREDDMTQARSELAAIRAEAARLKRDLERLKTLDLQLEQRTR